MTVRYTRGDILRCSEVEAVVNPVNCVGVMGKGLALEYRKRWPENFAAYKIACASGELQIGTVHIHKLALPGRPSFIINLPTKVHWRDRSELDGVGRGVVSLARLLSDVGIRSVAIPALGCGLGGRSPAFGIDIRADGQCRCFGFHAGTAGCGRAVGSRNSGYSSRSIEEKR